MKKIIVAFFLVVNLFMFLGILEIYEEKDLFYIHQLEVLQPNVVAEWVSVEDIDNELDNKALLSALEELTNRRDLLVSVRLGNYSKNQYEVYIAANKNIDESLNLVTDTSVNFNKTDAYYTSDENDEEGIFFYLLNKDLDITISPLSYLERMPNTLLLLTSNSSEELDEGINELMQQFAPYLTRRGEVGYEPFSHKEEMGAFLPVTIALTMICAFLLLMMYIHAKSKKIAIFKTLGVSPFATAVKLFFPLLCFIFLGIILINTALFYWFVRVVNAKTIPLILDLVKSVLYQMAGVLLVMVLGFLLLRFIPNRIKKTTRNAIMSWLDDTNT